MKPKVASYGSESGTLRSEKHSFTGQKAMLFEA